MPINLLPLPPPYTPEQLLLLYHANKPPPPPCTSEQLLLLYHANKPPPPPCTSEQLLLLYHANKPPPPPCTSEQLLLLCHNKPPPPPPLPVPLSSCCYYVIINLLPLSLSEYSACITKCVHVNRWPVLLPSGTRTNSSDFI